MDLAPLEDRLQGDFHVQDPRPLVFVVLIGVVAHDPPALWGLGRTGGARGSSRRPGVLRGCQRFRTVSPATTDPRAPSKSGEAAYPARCQAPNTLITHPDSFIRWRRITRFVRASSCQWS